MMDSLIMMQGSDDEDEVSHDELPMTSLSQSSEAITLEGALLVRKGRASGHSTFLYRKRSVYLHFLDGGSIDVYRLSEKEQKKTRLRTAISKLQKTLSQTNVPGAPTADHDPSKLEISVPAHLPWMAKDVINDPHAFVIEIPTQDAHHVHMLDESESQEDIYSNYDTASQLQLSSIPEDHVQEVLYDEMKNAKKMGRPLRIYFKCIRGNNEKALWIRAFSRLNRLSNERRTKKGILSTISSPIFKSNLERTRSVRDARIIADTKHLDMSEHPDDESIDISTPSLATDVTQLVRKRTTNTGKEKEYKVLPSYAYPHRWMTYRELRDEMNYTSNKFHDLRMPKAKQKEIGQLKVEVLQCLGLPKLDRTSDTDAIVYLVCGSFAFSTDVIPNRTSPMWLRNTKRACIFPLFHAYARLFVGVFDNDTKKTKDDFAGRVVLDLARLRPGSTYDVVLPLRLSSHVYSRRRRGAIRLRFTLNWYKERDALLSYIPKKIRFMLPQHSKPDFSTTIACADAKSFRNVAITVHGAHMPNRFTFQQMKAAIREINFTRKYIFTALLSELRETRTWVNPSVSAFVFLSWMHCVYANSFALVPAYLVLYLLLQLMRLYAKYGTDGPVQCGFVPPSWEELFMALVYGGSSDKSYIEPIELGLRPLPLARRKTPQTLAESHEDISNLEYKVQCHRPGGKFIFHLLGFVPRTETALVDQSHLEFPFADADIANYPKFGVRDSLVSKKGDKEDEKNISRSGSFESDDAVITTNKYGELRIIPRWKLEMPEMPHIMRKDSSGLNERDDEENEFAARRALRHGGVAFTKRAGKTITTATELTGLNRVVSPVRRGVGKGLDVARDVVTSPRAFRRSSSHDSDGSVVEDSESKLEIDEFGSTESRMDSLDTFSRDSLVSNEIDHALIGNKEMNGENGSADTNEIDLWPEQNIDIEGPSTGNKMTDDLADIKSKMHEFTWHVFDDHTYHIMDKDEACYFGEAKKNDKKRKKNLSSQLDKLLQVGQYSHPNPFIARVGMYVEPIVGSTYSFLCLFRAGYNIFIWRDPMLTFLITVVLGILAVVLFIFPWRIFMFFLGFGVLGPQNWVIRILREKGKLPPAKELHPPKDEPIEFDPTQQPIFGLSSEKDKDAEKPDPKEIQHIVVPYKPLVYQRFYDWPPEPQYAQVHRDASSGEDIQRRARGVPRNRPLTRRGGHRRLPTTTSIHANCNGSGLTDLPPLPRRRVNTGDWNPRPSESRAKLD